MAQKENQVAQKKVVDREVRLSNDWHFTLDDFNKNVQEETKVVKPEFKETVRFKVEKYSEPYCDNEYAGLFMMYKDYETDEEFNKRIQHEEKMKKMIEDRERAEFDRLSQKFAKK